MHAQLVEVGVLLLDVGCDVNSLLQSYCMDGLPVKILALSANGILQLYLLQGPCLENLNIEHM